MTIPESAWKLDWEESDSWQHKGSKESNAESGNLRYRICYVTEKSSSAGNWKGTPVGWYLFLFCKANCGGQHPDLEKRYDTSDEAKEAAEGYHVGRLAMGLMRALGTNCGPGD